MNVLPYWGQSSCRKAFGVVSPTEVKVFYLPSDPSFLLMPWGVWKHTWRYSPTSDHNHVGSGAPGSQNHPVPAGLGGYGCDLQLLIEVGEGLPSLAAGSGGDQENTRCFFPSIHGMKYTFYLTHFLISTQSMNAIQLLLSAFFHPSLLPTFPGQCQLPPGVGFTSAEPCSFPLPISLVHCHFCWDTGNDFAEQENF